MKQVKAVRYVLIVLISLLYISIIGLLLFFGITNLNQNLTVGIVLIAGGLLFLIFSYVKCRKTYLNKIKNSKKNL